MVGHVVACRCSQARERNLRNSLVFCPKLVYMRFIDISAERSSAPRVIAFADVFQNLDTNRLGGFA
jgi:hypothetical protein